MTEGLRWRVTKAVRRSDLPAPARLVMLTLADVAEVGTAEIPPQHTPSLSVLADETGLNESTVKRYLNDLERLGWLVRTRPSAEGARLRGERTRYRLALPPGVEVGAGEAQEGAQRAHEGAERAQPRAQEEPSPGRTQRPKKDSDLVQTEDRSNNLPPRLDVEQVCRHLADRIEENGSKRPTITAKWRDAARLLIDRDGKTVAQILRAIDWCQDDEFWRSNILSMPKLREQYDRLRLAAQRASPGRPTTADKVNAALTLADELERRQLS